MPKKEKKSMLMAAMFGVLLGSDNTDTTNKRREVREVAAHAPRGCKVYAFDHNGKIDTYTTLLKDDVAKYEFYTIAKDEQRAIEKYKKSKNK